VKHDRDYMMRQQQRVYVYKVEHVVVYECLPDDHCL